MFFDLAIGAVLGFILGLLSEWSLRLCVKKGINSGATGMATIWVVGGYVVRYAVLGLCVFVLARYFSLATGIMAMCVMAVTTLTVANINRMRVLKNQKGEKEEENSL